VAQAENRAVGYGLRKQATKIIQGTKVDLRIAYSASGIKEPTDLHAQRVYQNPQRSVGLPFPINRDHYEGDWVYMSFYSETGC
jgi:hypothetical protein